MDSLKKSPHKYAVIISWSGNPGDEVFVADVPELPGCTAHGDTHEEALENAQDAIALWLQTCCEDNVVPPPPGAISEIMRSEHVRLEKQGIPDVKPGIVRAQMERLCRESGAQYIASMLNQAELNQAS